METWHIFYALAVLQAFYTLAKHAKSQVGLLSPSAIFAMTVLIWFYPKVPDLATNYSFTSYTITRFLAFWLLCQSALFFGANIRIPSSLLSVSNTVNRVDNYKRWIIFSWVLFLIGALAFYQFTKLPPEMQYMRQPSGIITILIFFTTFLTISMIIAAFCYVQTRGWLTLIPLAGGVLLYANRIIIHGKRTELFELMFLLGFILIIRLRKRIPIPAWIAAGFLIIIFNAIVSDYRGVMKTENANVEQLQNIEIREQVYDKAFRADYDIINAVATFKAYSSSFQEFVLGADYWNVIVARYVPGQILGADVKKSLSIETGDALWQELGYTMALGTTTFSAGGLFRNFGWLSFLLLFLYGYYMRFLFLKANRLLMKDMVLYIFFGAMMPVVLIFGLRFFIGTAALWIPVFFIMDKLLSNRVKNRKPEKKLVYAASSD